MRLARLFVGVAVLLAFTAPADAQIGGLIKKKVAEVTGDKKAEAATQERASQDPDVLPMTDAVVTSFAAGLRTEIALRDEFRKVLATYKTREQYNKCTSELAMTEEGQKIVLQFANLPDNATSADIQRITEKMNVEMNALMKKHCGTHVDEEWPGPKRSAKLQEIEAKAAAEVKAGEEPDASLDGDVEETWAETAARASVRQYQILKERVVPFCKEYEKGTIKLDGKPVKFPGSGNNMYWVYTAEEAAALAKRCKELMALLEQLM
jgi:hypothetical protein